MNTLPEKYQSVVAAGISRVLTRAENSRGLAAEDLQPRLENALAKYIFQYEPQPERDAVREFLDEIRADDLCLVLACERGDEKAWEELVANFDATVRSAARKISANAEDADDLAGSIWAELYGLRQDEQGNKKSKLAYYSGRGSLGGWLRAVVSQLAIDEHRKHSKFVQIEEDREFENLASSPVNAADGHVSSHTDDPETLFTEQRTAAAINEALAAAVAELDADDRTMLKLYYFEGLKLRDIAAAYGFHEATASRRLVRIQAEIRKGVERGLRKKHGWTETELNGHLADAAAKLGMGLEQMLKLLIIAAIVQDSLR